MVWEEETYFSQREEVLVPHGSAQVPQQMEGLAKRGRGAYGTTSSFEGTRGAADYLDHEKRRRRSPHYAACEMADAILWLLSDEASFITGAMLDAAGGGYIL